MKISRRILKKMALNAGVYLTALAMLFNTGYPVFYAAALAVEDEAPQEEAVVEESPSESEDEGEEAVSDESSVSQAASEESSQAASDESSVSQAASDESSASQGEEPAEESGNEAVEESVVIPEEAASAEATASQAVSSETIEAAKDYVPEKDPNGISTDSSASNGAPEENDVQNEIGIWHEDENGSMTVLVEEGGEYEYKDSGLKIKFTRIDSGTGEITVKEIELTNEQVADLNALSSKAWDITSDMEDGTFEYELTLPVDESVNPENVEVIYAENEEDLNDGSKIKTVEKEDVKVDEENKEIVAEGLDHFTVFVVTTYADINLTLPKSIFKRGDTVYAEATGLTKSNSKFYKLDIKKPNGTTAATSNCQKNVSQLSKSYTLPSSAVISTDWLVIVKEYGSSANCNSQNNSTANGSVNFEVVDGAVSKGATVNNGCMDDLYPGNLNCTANDISIANVSGITIDDDGCTSPEDTVTFTANWEVFSTASQRYDIGLYFSTDGDPNGDGAYTGNCSITTLANSPMPPFFDFDGDFCGDASSSATVNTTIQQTVQCLDTDEDNTLNLPYCTSWRQNEGDVCNSPTDAFPGAPSKCNCETGFEIPITVPYAAEIEVIKDLIPSADLGKFSLQIDGVDEITNIGDGGTTGKVVVGAGTSDAPGAIHTVSETAGSGTNLDDYTTSISCVDRGLTTFDGGPALIFSGAGPLNVDVDQDDDIVCTITNTLKTGTLEVIKNVEPNNQNTNWVMTVAGPISFSDTLTGDDTTGAQSVNPGAYTIIETAGAGTDLSVYNTTWSCLINDVAGSSGTGTTASVNIAKNDVAICTFTNTLKTGTIKVIKSVTNDNGGTKTVGDFGINFSGGALNFDGGVGSGDTKTYTSQTLTLNAGSYTLSENDVAGYTEGAWDCGTVGASGLSTTIDLEAGQNLTCEITNDDEAGKLIVKKILNQIYGGEEIYTDFSFKINNGSNENFEADGENEYVVGAGNYTIVENAKAGYSISYDNCSGITVDNGETETCTITNTRDTGQLKAVKTIDDGTSLTQWNFKLNDGNWVAANANGEVDFGQVLTLTDYTIYEQGPAGYHLNSVSCTYSYTDNQDGSVTTQVAKGGTTVCTFNNNVDKGTITIVKEANPEDGQDFSFSVTGSGLSNFNLDDDADGVLSNTQIFSGLFPGDFTVIEDGETGWDLNNLSCVESGGQSAQNSNTDKNTKEATLKLEAGENITCIFTNTKRSSIIAHKFEDLNNDGDQDAGEANLGTWTMRLYSGSGCTGTQIASGATNNIEGNKIFSNLFPGSYSVKEDLKIGYDASTPICQDITVVAGEEKAVNFGNYLWAGVNVCKYNDMNGDGRFIGDSGLSGWEIRLQGPNGYDQTLTTGANSCVSFDHLKYGTFTFSEVMQDGWVETIPAGGRTYTATLSKTNLYDNLYITNFQYGKISGMKFEDANGDGVKDPGESGLQGWTIELDKNADGSVDDTKVTDADGKYEFTGLGYGTYRLREQGQSGWTQTTVNPVDILIKSGYNIQNIDFGNVQYATVTVYKEVDTDGDGDIDIANSSDWTWNIGDIEDLQTGTTASNILAGYHTISENQESDYHVTSLKCNNGIIDWNYYGAVESQSVEVVPGQNLECVFINTRDTGYLQVNKLTDENGDGVSDTGYVEGNNLGFRWGVEAETPTNLMGPASPVTLPTGNYNISENSISGYHFVGWFYGDNDEGCGPADNGSFEGTTFPTNIAITGNTTTKVTLCNARDMGSISVNKLIDTDGDGTFESGNVLANELGIKWTLDGGASNNMGDILSNIPTTVDEEKYVISEDFNSQPYHLVGWYLGDGSCDNLDGTTLPVEITVDKDTNASVTFCNARDMGTIVVDKVADPSGSAQEFTINLNQGLASAPVLIHSYILTDQENPESFYLPTGGYWLEELSNDGWDLTNASCVANSDPTHSFDPRADGFNLIAGDTITCTFTNTQRGSAAGQKYNDINGNGTKDDGEAGLSGWTIKLYNETGNGLLATKTTDAQGNYIFSNIAPNNYQVCEDNQPDWNNTDPGAGEALTACKQVTVEAGQGVSGIDFGNFELGEITVCKYTDYTGNGQYDSNEDLPLAGINMILSKNDGQDNWVQQTNQETGENGCATFSDLLVGQYHVAEDYNDPDLAGYYSTDGVIYHDINIASGSEETRTFLNAQYRTISGTKFNDLNGNGIRDAGEPGLENWTIFIDVSNKGILDPGETFVKTDASGNYEFTGLVSDLYTIAEVLETNWVQTYPTAGYYDVDMQTAITSSGNDFGNFEIGDLTVWKYEDTDGILGRTEGQEYWIGDPTFTFRLYKEDGGAWTLKGQQDTDSEGKAQFDNVFNTTGSYYVCEVKKDGWEDMRSLNNPANNNSGAIDEYPVCEGITVSTSGYGVIAEFGNIQLSDIHGYKWNDRNNDGGKDADEVFLPDWTINLYKWNGAEYGVEPIGTMDTDRGNDHFGWYWFEDLLPGQYKICEELKTGWNQTFPLNQDGNCHIISLPSGSSNGFELPEMLNAVGGPVYAFGNQQLGTINVTKYNDRDGDGAQNDEEEVLSGWTINLSDDLSAVTDENGNVTFDNLTPNKDYVLSETMREGWHQTNISCEVSQAAEGVLITAEGEAYGHHGNCAGWNNCENAETCAQWACEINGYSNLVSFGEQRPCTQFNNCHLFYNQGNIQWNWGNWCDVMGVTEIRCSDNTPIANQLAVPQEAINFDDSKQIQVNPGDVWNCSIGNQFIESKLLISKTNNEYANGPEIAGDLVTYTIEVEALKNDLKNVVVTDLPPETFEYIPGSWTASSSIHGSIGVPEPTYASPGDWNLGDMEDGEIITLTYQAKIGTETEKGIYPDLAWAQGKNLAGENLLALSTESDFSDGTKGIVDTNFVGTKIEVEEVIPTVKVRADKDEIIEEKEVEVKVKGATLPATGANGMWIIIASLGMLLGGIMIGAGYLLKNRKRMNKLIGVLLAVILTGLFAGNVMAAGISARLSEPATSVNEPFNLEFVAMDILNREMTVECQKKGPSDVGFVQFGSIINLQAGGDSDICPVDSAVLSEAGDYEFKIIAKADGATLDSNTVKTFYDGVGPATPKYIEKDEETSCRNEVTFKTADDGQTVKVEIYRSHHTRDIIANYASKIQTINIGPNQKYSFDDDLTPTGCGDNYFYAVRAFDSAGNPSSVRAEEFEVTIEEEKIVEVIEEQTGGGATATGGGTGATEGSAGEVSGEQTTGGEGEPAVGEGAQTEEATEVLGEQAEGNKIIGYLKNWKFWLVVVILVFIGWRVYQNMKKPKEEN